MKTWSNDNPKAALMERKRAAIVDAARQLFLASGYAQTSMDRVAEKAGVAITTLYRHFKNKDDLFSAVMQMACEMVAPELSAANNDDDSAAVFPWFTKPPRIALALAGIDYLIRVFDPQQMNLYRVVNRLYGKLFACNLLRMRVSFYPIERIEQGVHRGGADCEDFDPSVLPFDLGNEILIEDITGLIPDDEFEIYRAGIGSYAHARLEGLRYALVHRFPENEINEGTLTTESELVDRSRRIIRETAACLRLIRPTTQYLHLFEGRIDEDGRFAQVGRTDASAADVGWS